VLLDINREVTGGEWVNAGYAVVTVGRGTAEIVDIDDADIRDGFFGFAPSGGDAVIVAGGPAGAQTLRFYGPDGEVTREIPNVGAAPDNMNLFSPSGDRFITGCPDGGPYRQCVRDTASGREVARFTPPCTLMLGWYDENHAYCWAEEDDATMDWVHLVTLDGTSGRRLLETPDRSRLSVVFSRKPATGP
jgi:hypothetical protein